MEVGSAATPAALKPISVPGESGGTAFGGVGITTMADCYRSSGSLELEPWRRYGRDSSTEPEHERFKGCVGR